MKITVNPTLDIRTMKWLPRPWFEYSGRVIDFKGGTSQAQQNIDSANALSQEYAQQGQAEQAQILPFLNSEMKNPVGLTPGGVNELETAGGQATSGALGGAKEAANLKASRTGNPSTSSSIIDAAARAGMDQQSNNVLGVKEADLQAKLAQQQAGEQGIAALSSGNIGESLSALGLSNEAVSDYINAYKGSNPLSQISSALGEVGTGVGAAAHGILGA